MEVKSSKFNDLNPLHILWGIFLALLILWLVFSCQSCTTPKYIEKEIVVENREKVDSLSREVESYREKYIQLQISQQSRVQYDSSYSSCITQENNVTDSVYRDGTITTFYEGGGIKSIERYASGGVRTEIASANSNSETNMKSTSELESEVNLLHSERDSLYEQLARVEFERDSLYQELHEGSVVKYTFSEKLLFCIGISSIVFFLIKFLLLYRQKSKQNN